jgi:hypothetical protein
MTQQGESVDQAYVEHQAKMLWHAERQTSALNAIKVAVWILAGLAILGALAALTAVF